MNKEQCESENNIVNMDRTTQMIEDDTDNDTIIQLSSELSKVCRCCLENKIDMKSLYESDNFFPDLIMIIAAVVINTDDGLPNQICVDCIHQISKTIAFKQQIETADATLKHYASQGYFAGVRDPKSSPVETFDEIEEYKSEASSSKTLTNNLVENLTNNEDCDEEDEKDEEMDNEDDDVMNYDECDYLDEEIQELETTNSMNVEEEKKNKTIIKIENESVNNSVYNDGDDSDESLNTKKTKKKKIIESDSETEYSAAESDEQQVEDVKEKLKQRKSGRKLEKKDLFCCSVCGKQYTCRQQCKRHEKCHTWKKKYPCKMCVRSFKTSSAYLRHLRKHSEETKTTEEYPFYCSQCLVGFNVESDLQIHNSIHSNDGQYICSHCKKEFTTSIQLKRHVKIHFEDKPYKCIICKKGFPEMGSLTRHVRRHTGERREKKHLCNVCGKGYYDSHALSIHTRTHTGEKPWVCNICGKSFIDSRLLNSHMKIHSSEKPHACEFCDRKFTHLSTLTTHLRTHTGEKPYICSVCGKTFIQSSNLGLHMRVHSGEKPYTCSVCDKKFASSSTLTMHMRIHTGEKPYKCKTCGKAFARHDLSAHLRTHTGEKPYTCSYCSKKFTTGGQLNQHLRTHTGIKPFECDICQKRCSSSSYLKKHIRSHFNSTTDQPLVETYIITHAENEAQSESDKSKNLNETNETHMINDQIIMEQDEQNISMENTNIRLIHSTSNTDHNLSNIQIATSSGNMHHSQQECHIDEIHHIDIRKQHDSNIPILAVNANDLITVVNNHVQMQVPVLTSNDSNCQTTLISSLDGKYIYQAIDPRILRIQQVHSGCSLNPSNLEENQN